MCSTSRTRPSASCDRRRTSVATSDAVAPTVPTSLISVVSAEGGGENNALAHFASDVQILTSRSHRRIPRVIEGLWVGKDSFAVVSERVQGSTLTEMLSAGERLPNPRIACVLLEVNEVLESGRESRASYIAVSRPTRCTSTAKRMHRVCRSRSRRFRSRDFRMHGRTRERSADSRGRC